MDDSQIARLLGSIKIIAVVGCSRDISKDAYKVPEYLQRHGYKIIPVNPLTSYVLGEKSYKLASEIKDRVDIVLVFRPSEDVLSIVQDVLKMENKPRLVWMQLGIQNQEAANLARENGIDVIENRCIKIEHNRLLN